MQSRSQARDPNQLSDDGLTLNTTLTRSEHDPYYSNRDIAILHSIVATAQHQLDHSPGPQPLPAAVLFKAYDDVLPEFGIDPDSDYHLSAFVFRIGGEQGHGNLFDRFQAILGRMGVELEFGDETTLSAQTSPSSPSPAQLHSGQLGLRQGRRIADSKSSRSDILCDSDYSVATDVESLSHTEETSLHRRLQSGDDRISASRAFPATEAVAHLDHDAGTRLRHSEDWRGLHEDSETPVLVDGRRALVSAVDPLHLTVAIEPPSGGSRAPIAGDQDPEPRIPTATKRFLAGSEELRLLHGLSANPDRDESQKGHPILVTQVAQVKKPADDSLQHAGRPPLGSPATSDVAVRPAQQERLLHRASRARQIYLASKVFNHWADRTALRLEREAVARRHMIRFRCFRGWSEMSSSKLPAADHLKAATAVQKLRRAVMQQEEQLSLAASAITGTYRVNLARHTLEQWTCQYLGHALRHELGKRSRLVATRDWKQLAWENAQLGTLATVQMARQDMAAVIGKWSRTAAGDRRRAAAAQQVEPVRQFLAHLVAWLNQTELKQRSLDCERHLLMKRASMSFDTWNLGARARAFRWRCEYSTATTTLQTWLRKTTEHGHFSIAARSHHELASKAKFGRQIKQIGRKHAALGCLQHRARLYIGGNLLLELFTRAARERKSRIRGSIRRYLMLRYTQVSSKKRRRAFLAALDHWQTATAACATARTKDDYRSTSAAERRLSILAAWGRQTLVEHQGHLLARNHCREGWLRFWDERSARQSYLYVQAWRLWALRQERLCFKQWSIATLQRSGQAHTAVVARLRHSRETRSRVLQRWKASFQVSRRDALGQKPDHADGLGPLSGPRNRSAGRLWSSKQNGSVSLPMETPTRWTGLPMPMTNVLSSRLSTIIGDADDETGPIVGSFRNPKIQGLRHGRLADSTSNAPSSPSTTPLGPLPAQFERSAQASRWKPGRAGRSEFGRPARARPDLRAVDPWRTPARSAEAVGGLLGGFDLSIASQPLVSAAGRAIELRRAESRQYSQSASVTSATPRRRIGQQGVMPSGSVSEPPGSAPQRDTAAVLPGA